jgi:hypothetical protein
MSRERRLSANGSRRAPQRRGALGVFPVSLSKCPMVWVMDRQFPATQGTSGVFPVGLSKWPMVSVMDRLPSPTQRIRALPGCVSGQPLKTPDGMGYGQTVPRNAGHFGGVSGRSLKVPDGMGYGQTALAEPANQDT